MAHYTGKNGAVFKDGVAQDYAEWDLDIDGELPDVTSFLSGGCQENVPGIDRATVTLRGPYSSLGYGLTRGVVYTFRCQIGGVINFDIDCRVKKLHPSTNVVDASRFEVQAISTGVFSISLA